MPSPSTSRPAPRVRHGIANTSAIAWCAGSSSPGTPSVNTTCSATPKLCASRCSDVQVRAAADDDQGGAGHPLPDRGHRPDQHVLALARHQPRHAHHDRPLAQPVPGTQFGAGDLVGREPVGVHAGRQVLQRGVRPERRGEPAARVAADIGDHVGAGSDAPQRGSGQRQHRPADLVAVGAGDDAAGTRVAGQRRHQRQRRGGAEPHGVDVVALDELTHPAGNRRHGQHQRAGMAHHLVGRPCAIELVGALPLRRVDRQRVCPRRGQVVDQFLQVRLDAAASRRKVIANQQDPAHRQSG